MFDAVWQRDTPSGSHDRFAPDDEAAPEMTGPVFAHTFTRIPFEVDAGIRRVAPAMSFAWAK